MDEKKELTMTMKKEKLEKKEKKKAKKEKKKDLEQTAKKNYLRC